MKKPKKIIVVKENMITNENLIEQNRVLDEYIRIHNPTDEKMEELRKNADTFLIKILTDKKLYDKLMKKVYNHLLNYVKENVHQHGAVYRAGDLIKRIIGEDLNPDYFMKYIEDKFYPIYKL